MDQGSEAWHKWRSEGIGASQASVLLGVSEWQTPHQLFLEKTGQGKPQRSNWAMERGIRVEPLARTRVSILLGLDFQPRLFEHKIVRQLRCSLDGYDEKTQTVLEIKVPGKEVFEEAKAGRVHASYRPQCEWQMMVTEAKRLVFYVVQVDKNDHIVDDALVEYQSDKDLQYELLMKAIEFQQRIERGEAPPLTDRDFKEIECEVLAFKELAEVKALLEKCEQEAKALKERQAKLIEDLAGKHNHTRLKCTSTGVELVQVRRLGNVDWQKVAEDRGISNADLHGYRKKDLCYWTVKLKA